ncbi:MAG: hypothetical protein HZB40_19225 [Rhodocyclales bacterium]|nr:hypothetical protein [Rhodocyclales bacterium]
MLPKRVFDSDAPHSAHRIDALSVAALAYLALPVIIFLTSWLRPWYAVLVLGLAAAATHSALTRVTVRWQGEIPAKHFIVILVVGLAWAAMGGGSHFVYANPDWLVRDSIIGDLTFSEWPPSYGFRDGSHYLLRSAIGFFLPIAAVAKQVGPQWLGVLVFAWTALGTILFLVLLPLPNGSFPRLLLALAVIICFSGMDVLGTLLLHGQLPIFPLRIEWWGEFAFRTAFSYSSLTGQLLWAPNHALPIWIATALFYRHWKQPDFIPYLCLLLPVLPLSTPFALPGLAPFLVFMLLDRWRSGQGLGRLPGPALAFALVVGGLILRLQTLDIDAIVVRSGTEATIAEGGGTSGFIRNYFVFVLMEFAILGFALFPVLRHSRGILALAMGVLALLPLLSLGPSNDLVLRVSTPSLVLMAILCQRALFDEGSPRRYRKGYIAVVLLIGLNTPFNELWRAATWRHWPANYTRTFPDTQGGVLPPHYVGRLDDPVLRNLMRTPSPIPTAQQRKDRLTKPWAIEQ